MPALMDPPQRSPEPSLLWRHTNASIAPNGDAYQPFGNVAARNGLQERVEIPLLIVALRLPIGCRVLEVGCGRGVALPVLSRWLLPRELVGVDVDPTLVDIASRRVCRQRVEASVIEADVRSLPFDDWSFDMVIDFGTCYHVGGGASGSLAAMREIARVIAPRGLFVHETPVAQHLAHPVRSFGRSLPWRDVPSLSRDRSALLWCARRKSMLPY